MQNPTRRWGALASAAIAVGALGTAVLVNTPQAGATPVTPSAADRAASAAASLVAQRASVLQASSDDAFQQLAVQSSHGLQYVPYTRTYRNLPVVGGDFVVVTNSAGQVLNTSVAQSHPVALRSTTPTVTAATAAATARHSFTTVGAASASRLVVLQQASSRLAWESTIAGISNGEYARNTVYVDALTNKVLATKEHVAEGTGSSAYAGTVTIPTSLSGSTYSMKNPNATTMVCQDAANNTTFTGPDDSWGNGNATSRETGCVDALYTAEQERLMLSNWLGRNGMNGSGGWVPIRVGLNDVNAYYDGTQVQVGHTQTGGKWIGSLDVVGHENGHGVDDNTPGGISGGNTQEFVADTFGASTEWYANNSVDTPDFTVGEQVNLVGSGPIRYMYNPSLAGDDNCYSSSIPSEEVHAAAGPGNHWFYLLAEGTSPSNGQPTSPTCNSSSVTGLGVQKAMTIMYNAMLMKTSSSSYLKYRTWTLTAAKNLYPSSCTEFNTVKAAWDAVSVPAQSGDPTCTGGGGGNTVTVTNPGAKTGTVGTATSLQIQASDSASGQTLTYSATGLPAGLSINSSSGLISGTPTTAATYTVTAKATDTTGASGTATFTWTISGGGGGSCSGQKLANPGFESGATSWTQSSGVINTDAAHSRTGSGYAWLDGYGSTHTDTLSQTITIPTGCKASLTFYLYISSSEGTTTAYDKLSVTANGTQVASYSNVNKGTAYVLRTVSLNAYAGQSVTIKFTGTEDSSLATSFFVDDTGVTLS